MSTTDSQRLLESRTCFGAAMRAVEDDDAELRAYQQSACQAGNPRLDVPSGLHGLGLWFVASDDIDREYRAASAAIDRAEQERTS